MNKGTTQEVWEELKLNLQELSKDQNAENKHRTIYSVEIGTI